MKRLLITPLLLSAILVTITSCKKEKEEQPLDKGVKVPFITAETLKTEETIEVPMDTIKDKVEEQPVVNVPKEEKKVSPKNTSATKKKQTPKNEKRDQEDYPLVDDTSQKKPTVTNDFDTIYTEVTTKAYYPGGMPAFNKQFISRFKIPEIDLLNKRVQILTQFVVNLDGSLSDIVFLKESGYGIEEEIIRVLNNMPKWKPAILEGRPVRSLFTLPITIQVQ
jgi:protein TonB